MVQYEGPAPASRGAGVLVDEVGDVGDHAALVTLALGQAPLGRGG